MFPGNVFSIVGTATFLYCAQLVGMDGDCTKHRILTQDSHIELFPNFNQVL